MYSPFHHIGSIIWKRRPIHLTFFVTRKCNASCPYCFYLESNNSQSKCERELSLDEIKKIALSTGKLLWLALSGGEVYLRKDLVEICQCFYDHCNPSIILLPSNGLAPNLIEKQTIRILDYCKNSVVVVKLSVDGIGQYHNDFRKTPGNFDKVMETYKLLQGLLEKYDNFELGINTTLHSKNQTKVEQVIEFVGDMKKIGTHTVSLVRGHLNDESYKVVDPENYHRSSEKLKYRLENKISDTYRFKGSKLKAAQDILQRKLIHETLVSGEKSIPCYAGNLNLVLTESGDVYPCEILSDSFGNVRNHNYDLMKTATGKLAKEIKKTISNKNIHCKSCTHECNYMMNILFNPLMYPSLLKEYINLKKR